MPPEPLLMNWFQHNSGEIRRLWERVHATFDAKDREAWKAACTEFHRRYDQLAFPGGYEGALERILVGDVQTINAALSFVECRPYFFRSGYMYKDLLRKLKRAPLNARNAKRLERVLEAYADYRRRRRSGTQGKT